MHAKMPTIIGNTGKHRNCFQLCNWIRFLTLDQAHQGQVTIRHLKRIERFRLSRKSSYYRGACRAGGAHAKYWFIQLSNWYLAPVYLRP